MDLRVILPCIQRDSFEKCLEVFETPDPQHGELYLCITKDASSSFGYATSEGMCLKLCKLSNKGQGISSNSLSQPRNGPGYWEPNQCQGMWPRCKPARARCEAAPLALPLPK